MKNLTIAVVDTAYHVLASRAIEKALEVTGSNSVLVLSDRDFYPGSKYVKVDVITDKFEYSKLVLKELGKHVTTDFILTIQYDGMPIDSTQWQNEFLNYDYIGAPWRWYPKEYCVGNGGFSLRSRKLTDYCLEDSMIFSPGPAQCQEDVHICILYKDWLLSKGIKYSPVALAAKFSAEEPGGRFNTFGFHGSLCLPFYLDDGYLSFYVSQLSEAMFESPQHIRLLFSLICADRPKQIREFMVRALTLKPNFKDILLKQFPLEAIYFPGLSLNDVEKYID